MKRDRPDLRLVRDEDAAKLFLYPEGARKVHAFPVTRPVPKPPNGPKAA